MEGSSEKVIERRTERIKKWLWQPYNLALTIVVAFAVIVRIYFLTIAKNQAHWWDSLAFGSLAKEMIYHYWSNNAFIINETTIRPPFFSLIWSWLLRLNFSDYAVLIFLDIIPSVLSVFFVYLLAKELYDKKTAIISSAILAPLWIHLFYSVRIMSDIPSLFFTLASMYFFAKSYEKIEIKPFALSVFFIALAILTRYFYGIIGALYIIFMIFSHGKSLIKNKNFWIGGLIGALPVIIFLLANLAAKGSLLPAFSIYAGSAAQKAGFAYYTLSFIPYIFGKIITGFFILGVLIALGNIVIGFDKLKEIKSLKSHLFLITLFVVPLAFFIFWMRASEDRYLFISIPSMIILSAVGLGYCQDYIKKYSKYLAIALVIAVLLVVTYGQITFANNMIENKKTSYSQMKDAFLWIKENTPKDAVLLGDGIDPYAIYYSERRLAGWSSETINESTMQADYIVLHGFEHQTKELIDYVNNRTGKDFLPVQAYFFDADRTQPAVIVYKVEKKS